MARLPKLCIHPVKNLWYVRVRGQFVYLGNANQVTEAEAEAARLRVLQQHAAGRPVIKAHRTFTVQEVVDEYLTKVVEVRYRHTDGTHTHEVRNFEVAFRPLCRVFGDLVANDFDGSALESLQKVMAGDEWKNSREKKRATSKPWCTSQINKHISRVKRMYKWAAGKKMVPAELVGEHALVEALKPGQHGTTEPDDIPPVSLEVIEATLPNLTRVVADMVRLQLLTGSRPGEICALTPDQVDLTGDQTERVTKGAFRLPPGCWAIVPRQHKTRHCGKARIIPVGPQAIAILQPYLEGRPKNQPVFSPRESRETHLAERRAGRQTPMTPSQKARQRKTKPVKAPSNQYDTAAYGAAVRKAARKANQPHWHPHQLRHTAATLLAREFGVEVARIVCGHSSLSATGIYVERDLAAAFAAIAKVG